MQKSHTEQTHFDVTASNGIQYGVSLSIVCHDLHCLTAAVTDSLYLYEQY